MGWFNSQDDKEFKDLLIATYDIMGDLINELNATQGVTATADRYISQMSSQVSRLYQMNNNGKFDSVRVVIDGQMVSGRDSLVGFFLFAKDVERKTGRKFPLNI